MYHMQARICYQNVVIQDLHQTLLVQRKFGVYRACQSYEVGNMDSVHHEVYEVKRGSENGQLVVYPGGEFRLR